LSFPHLFPPIIRDIAIGAMFRIALHQLPSSLSLTTLASCLAYFPLSGDQFTARETHDHFVRSLLAGSKSLLGAEGELLERCLAACCRLIDTNNELGRDLLEEAQNQHEYDELCESQCLCYARTRDDLTFLLKTRHLEGVDPAHIAGLARTNPELSALCVS
jgi:hypothetical protein